MVSLWWASAATDTSIVSVVVVVVSLIFIPSLSHVRENVSRSIASSPV